MFGGGRLKVVLIQGPDMSTAMVKMNFFGTRAKRNRNYQKTFQNKKKLEKFKNTVIKANASHIEKLESQILKYHNRLRYIQKQLSDTTSALQSSTAQRYELEDTINNSNDDKNDESIEIIVKNSNNDKRTYGLGKKNGKCYTNELKLACIQLRCLNVCASSMPEVIKTILEGYGLNVNEFEIPIWCKRL